QKATPPQEASAPATPRPSPSSAGALSGTHVVQVAAFGSQAEADQSWTRLQKKLGDYLAGKSEDVERADLGAKGVYYRLRIGPFSSTDDAKTFCEGLKSRGQDCLVKAK
ncbi:MAG TPA: SPOR domain-containing protein, partial [Parvularculaceae bacterium]|nr:SPOR domain-containing protein [Parvularculaceae bacterium]